VPELGGGLVPDVDAGQLLDRVEGEEADGREQHHPVERLAEVLDGLRDEVEEGRTDPDARPGRDDQAHVTNRSQRHEPARQGGHERGRRHEQRADGHQSSLLPGADWQAGHSPNSSSRWASMA
jgi:hypothetical protein